MADKAIYSVDTVTSMSDTDKVYVNTGNNIKQITKDNLCGNDIKGINNQVQTLKTEVNNNTNAISEIKANIDDIGDINHNLDNLSYGETAGGKNLFKIDTTNWTLTDNGIKNNAKNDGYLLGKIKLFAGKAYKISFLLKSKPTVDSSFTAYIDGSVYSACTFAHFNSYALNVKVENDYTATSDCELLYRLWGNSNSDIFEFQLQVEEGTVATDYKPYIPSVKMLSDDVSNINSNMSDYGLNNVFDGELVNGYHDWTNGNFVNDTTVVEVKNAISVNNGDTVSVKTERIFEYICCVLFNGETYVSGDYVQNNNEFTFMIPSGVNRVYVYFSNGATITPSTAGHIGVYINNQIDVVRNDVDDLKNDVDRITYDCGRALFGGSAATITQGGATWYAYGVGVLFAKEYNSFPGVQLTVIVPAGTLAIANLTNITTTGFEATIWSLTELNGGTLEYMISEE